MLSEFELYQPGSLEEACSLKKQGGRILAGGTDVLVMMHNSGLRPESLVDIKGLSALKGIRCENGLDIGALVTHRQMETMDLVKKTYTALYEGCSQVGSVQIRHRGTLGGNICNAVPSADSIGPLLVFDAQCGVFGLRGRRSVALKDFFTGPKRTVLEEDEVLERIRLAQPKAHAGSAYTKFTRRNAMDLALFGVSCYVEMAGDIIANARVALTTSAPTPMRAYQTEALLKGKRVDDELLLEAGKCAESEAKPRTSWRSSAEYRYALTRELTQRTLRTAVMRANGVTES